MFCNEPIIKILYANILSNGTQTHDFVFSPVLEMRLVKDAFFIMQTENHYIVAGNGKVKLTDNISRFEQRPYDLYEADYNLDDDHHEAIETTILRGRKLSCVTFCDRYTELDFEGLTLKMYLLERVYWEQNTWFYPIPGTADKLKKCRCGGEATLYLDEAGDFYAYCPKCKRATWPDMDPAEAVHDWNHNTGNIHISDWIKPGFWENENIPVDFIYFDRYPTIYDVDLFDFMEMTVSINNHAYRVEVVRTGEDVYDFAQKEFNPFEPDDNPYVLKTSKAEPLAFVRKTTTEYGTNMLLFKKGTKPILITADYDYQLTVGFAAEDENGNEVKCEEHLPLFE